MATAREFVYHVEAPPPQRNRLTVAFRPILAIPHLLLVGGPGVGIGIGADRTGALGGAAAIAAVINWFAIVFRGRPVADIFDLQTMYLRWRAGVLAYEALLRDEYPRFGDRPYPVHAEFPAEEGERNRWSVGFRLLLTLPHLVVLFLLFIAWLVTAVVGWFAVLVGGSYPDGLWKFGEGVMRWSLRVESYLLLLNDDYPPFSLE